MAVLRVGHETSATSTRQAASPDEIKLSVPGLPGFQLGRSGAGKRGAKIPIANQRPPQLNKNPRDAPMDDQAHTARTTPHHSTPLSSLISHSNHVP